MDTKKEPQKSSIYWLVIPCAYSPEPDRPARFKVSVVASPKITPPPGRWADPKTVAWLADWPNTLRALHRAGDLKVRIGLRSSGLTHTVAFNWDTGPDAGKGTKFGRAYPKDTSRSLWLDLFSTPIAEHKIARPKATTTGGRALSSLGELAAARALTNALREGALRGEYFEPLLANSALATNLERLAAQSTLPDDSVRKLDRAQAVDFNRVVSGLLHYSELAREVGLVLDGSFIADLQPAHIEWVQLEVPQPDEGPELQFGRVAVENRSDGRFAAARRGPSKGRFGEMTERRLFRFGDATVIQELDPVAAVKRSQSPRSAGKGGAGPVLRSDHVLVMNDGVSSYLEQRRERAKDLAGEPKALLYAEDIARGITVDLHHPSRPKWFSLNARALRFRARPASKPDPAGTGALPPGTEHEDVVTDEGHVQFSALGEAGFDIWFVSDVAFRLNGWNMVCPYPLARSAEPPLKGAGALLKLEEQYAPPGTVLTFRWGEPYALRGRCQDLAGVDMSKQFKTGEDQGPDEESLKFDFMRVDAVPPPEVGFVPDEVPPAAQRPDSRVVVARVTRDQATQSGKVRRALVPPSASFQMAEFDGQTRGVSFAQLKRWYARKDVTALNDKNAARKSPAHLPDPHSVGAMVELLPSESEPKRKLVKFRGSWPDHRHVELVVIAGAHRPSPELEKVIDEFEKTGKRPQDWNPLTGRGFEPLKIDGDRIVLEVPFGESFKLSVRSLLELDTLKKKNRVWREWLTDDDRWKEFEELPEKALNRLAPATTVIVECPTAFPLMNPRFVKSPEPLAEEPTKTEVRRLGETASQFDFTIRAHVPTTGQVELLASWREPLATPDYGKWEREFQRVPVAKVPINVSLGGTSDGYPDGMLKTRLKGSHYHHDGRRRVVKYELRGSTRFTSDFPAEGVIEANSVISGEHVVDVPASTPPAVPTVDIILPAFLTEEEAYSVHGRKFTSHGDLRIYLGATWWSSGTGEMLAVVMPASEADAARHSVTGWGNDPIRAERVQQRLRLSDERETRTGFRLERGAEVGLTADLKLYRVQWDPARRSWFADVRAEVIGAEQPMIQLGLARYQPVAVEGAHLSDVVRAEFVQLSPTRHVLVTLSGNSLHVHVNGPGAVPTKEHTIIAAVFREGRGPDELPTDKFDDLLRAGEPSTGMSATDLGAMFKFENLRPRRGDRLVVWEIESRGPSGAKVPFRACSLDLTRLA